MSYITIVTVEQACFELSLSEPTMRRYAKIDPTFPQKIRLAKRRVGYLRSDIEKYLNQQSKEIAPIRKIKI